MSVEFCTASEQQQGQQKLVQTSFNVTLKYCIGIVTVSDNVSNYCLHKPC